MTCQNCIYTSGIPVRFEVFLSTAKVSPQPLLNNNSPDNRASISMRDPNFVTPIDWLDSDCNELWSKCVNLRISNYFTAPCLVDLALLNNFGPYFINIWGIKNNAYPVTIDDGILIRPEFTVTAIDNNEMIKLVDWTPLVDNPQPFFNGLNAFAFQPEHIQLIANSVPHTDLISPNVFLEIALRGSAGNIYYPSNIWQPVCRDAYTSNIASYLSSSTIKTIGQFLPCQPGPTECWLNALCGSTGPLSRNFCACAQFMQQFGEAECSCTCQCLDPNGYYANIWNHATCLLSQPCYNCP